MRERWIVALVGGHLLVGLGLTLLAARGGPELGSLWQVGALAGGLALVGLFPLRLELRRSACAVLLVDAVVVIALFSVAPLGVALAATVGEVVACLTLRMPPLQVLYSAAATLPATLAAALTFALFGGARLQNGDPSAWLAAIGAMAVFLVYNYTATTLVRSVVKRRRINQVAKAGAVLYA